MGRTVRVTEDGAVVFPREALDHLGIGPGESVELDLRPGGEAVLRAAPEPTEAKAGRVEALFGMLGPPPRSGPPPTIEEMNRVIALGWSGRS